MRRGAVFSLDYPLTAFDPPMSRSRSAPTHTITCAHEQSRDDSLDGLFLQASSHVDGLRHRRASGHGFYDGVADAAIVTGTPQLGVQAWADDPIVGRGLLLDVEALLSSEGTPLDHRDGPAVDAGVLDRAAARQGVVVEPGDLVLAHTGWAKWFLDATDDERRAVRDERRATGFAQQRSLLEWLWDNQIAMFATDTFAVEVLPVLPSSPFRESAPEDLGMMHQELIAKLGVPLGELWNLTALVEDSRRHGQWDALLVVKPLALVGGVGSPCNATAIR
ncbi:cyclase family protein [Mycolicibacterium sp. 120266]|uniref:cyclase family protein n=1 Tax=Mycolicibacterium sp. 120266 TaxID=3090601 RepID=UPI00299DCFC8|nr:cyclase family protein [Mycolicibacterium sp. 120266]MDX1874134.1 cyclase family protein [Mycolicibacterium sp. 120266]